MGHGRVQFDVNTYLLVMCVCVCVYVCVCMQRQFQFDVHTMILAVGPWRVPIPLKRDAQPIDKMDTK